MRVFCYWAPAVYEDIVRLGEHCDRSFFAAHTKKTKFNVIKKS